MEMSQVVGVRPFQLRASTDLGKLELCHLLPPFQRCSVSLGPGRFHNVHLAPLSLSVSSMKSKAHPPHSPNLPANTGPPLRHTSLNLLDSDELALPEVK